MDWSKIYRVSLRLRKHSPQHFEALSSRCNELPTGYADFISTFGVGFLDDIKVMDITEILAEVDAFRDLLGEWFSIYADIDMEPILAPIFCRDAIMLAKTGWGAKYFCSPSQPGVLWHLPRSQDWEELPSVIPLGFHNPFVHCLSSGELIEYGAEDLVFTPDNPRSSIHRLINNGAEDAGLIDRSRFLVEHINFDKISESSHRISYYSQHLSLVVSCSMATGSLRVAFEFDKDMLSEVSPIVEAISSAL